MEVIFYFCPFFAVFFNTVFLMLYFLYTQGRYKSLFFKTGETPVLEDADETCLPSGMASMIPENAEFITSYSILAFSESSFLEDININACILWRPKPSVLMLRLFY